jgi:hypothetical protein
MQDNANEIYEVRVRVICGCVERDMLSGLTFDESSA